MGLRLSYLTLNAANPDETVGVVDFISQNHANMRN